MFQVRAEETEHQECRTTHKHQSKLHSRILLATCAPDTDKKIHRDQSHLIEHEHGEHVDRDEEAEHTGGEEREPEEEILG